MKFRWNLLLLAAAWPASAGAAGLEIHHGAPAGSPGLLTGADAVLQLLVTATDAPGRQSDATRAVS